MSYLRDGLPRAATLGLIFTVAAMTGCSGGGSGSLPASANLTATSTSTLKQADTTSSKKVSAARRAAESGESSYSSVVLSDSPLAYYQLSDSGSTMIDTGPNSLSGSYGGDVTLGQPAITLGGVSASKFPGGSSYDANGFASTAPTALLQPGTVTLEAWIQCTAANTTSHDIPIVVYGTANVGVRYGMSLHGMGDGTSSLLYIQHNAGQANALTLYGATHLKVGITYHLIAVSDGTNVTTYINGLQDKTAAYSGSIDYSAPILTGIQIGNDKQTPGSGASASFPGTIAQVAIYGKALTQSQIVNHFLAGQLVPPISELATKSDSFVDSIGVNAHFEDPSSLYETSFPQVSSLLASAGIRHIRVGINLNNSAYQSQMQQLAAMGIHGSYTTSLDNTQSEIVQFASQVAPSLEQIEAPNEQDDQGNSNWVPSCIAFQQNLYQWVKGNPATAQIPVLGPALAAGSSFPMLGDVSSYLDFANIHDYFAVFNPGTSGWGSQTPYGGYGSIAYNTGIVTQTSGTKPVIATESGYGTLAGYANNIDLRTDLRYITRLFFEQFKGGIKRTYSYELIDHGGTGVFASFGLLQGDLTPKPSYTGVKSLIAALSDPGSSSFQPSALTYQVSGFNQNVHHLLMQKKSGAYILALWIESQDWNSNGGGDIIVPNQQVTLTTATKFGSASLSTMDENGNFSSAPLAWNGQQASINVTDKVSLVTLVP